MFRLYPPPPVAGQKVVYKPIGLQESLQYSLKIPTYATGLIKHTYCNGWLQYRKAVRIWSGFEVFGIFYDRIDYFSAIFFLEYQHYDVANRV